MVPPGGGSGTSLLLRLLLGAALSALLLAPAAWAQGKPQSRGVRAHYEYASGCGKDGPPECPWRAGQKSLIVDTDPGLGLSFTDIDECATGPPPPTTVAAGKWRAGRRSSPHHPDALRRREALLGVMRAPPRGLS